MSEPRLDARVEIDAGERTFASGLLLDLLSALRNTADGDLIGLTTPNPEAIQADLDAWSRLTGHAIVGRTRDHDTTRWVIRHGAPPPGSDDDGDRHVGERLWLYTNYDCNLKCDYCCVRSSPGASRRELGLDRVQRIAREAPPLGVREFFVTGGEPFLLADIDELLITLADARPVTVLTNGMLFRGSRLRALTRLPRERVTLQISLDSPDPLLHDTHRGQGAWQRALEGIDLARAEGFRVRLAATVSTEAEEAQFRTFLVARQIALEDHVIRRVALRGFATNGVALSRADLVPEVTLTADGVYWHPVGADDEDFLVRRELFPLSEAFEAVLRSYEQERAHSGKITSIFRCA